jgi:hypothetical protein
MHIFRRYVVENEPALLTQDDHPLLGGRWSHHTETVSNLVADED